jgi:hypothetical protein
MMCPPVFDGPLRREGIERLGRAERIVAGVWKTYDRGTEDDPPLIILPAGILKVDALIAVWFWDRLRFRRLQLRQDRRRARNDAQYS